MYLYDINDIQRQWNNKGNYTKGTPPSVNRTVSEWSFSSIYASLPSHLGPTIIRWGQQEDTPIWQPGTCFLVSSSRVTSTFLPGSRPLPATTLHTWKHHSRHSILSPGPSNPESSGQQSLSSFDPIFFLPAFFRFHFCLLTLPYTYWL